MPEAFAIVTGVLATVNGSITAVQTISEYVSKFKIANLKIAALRTECLVVRLALIRIQDLSLQDHSWTHAKAGDAVSGAIRDDFVGVLDSCSIMFSILNERLAKFDLGDLNGTDQTPAWAKLKYAWNEQEIEGLQNNISRLVNGLNLLINALQSETISKTYKILHEQKSVQMLKAVCSDAESLRSPSRASTVIYRDDEVRNRESSILGDENFEFDEILINAKAYRKAMSNRQQRKPSPIVTDEEIMRSAAFVEDDQDGIRIIAPPSENSKHQAYRSGGNLQHPQPRLARAGRWQHRLQSEAQYAHDDVIPPALQTSPQWDLQATVNSVPVVLTGPIEDALEANVKEPVSRTLRRSAPMLTIAEFARCQAKLEAQQWAENETSHCRRDQTEIKPRQQLWEGERNPAPGTEPSLVRKSVEEGKGANAVVLDETDFSRGLDGTSAEYIVALMDHLTVRDAGRTLGDTVVLVDLVRAAAEMRKSFEDIKSYIAEQAMTVDTVNDQGPPKLLASASMTREPITARSRTPLLFEDKAERRRNVFRRAWRGLGSKSTKDLQDIEASLMSILADLESLRS